MRNAQDPSKVIVLGAGFSAHADFPLVKGMRRAVLDYVQADQGRFFSCENMREQFYEGLKEADVGLAASGCNADQCFEELLLQLQAMKAKATDRFAPAVITDYILRCATGRLLWKKSRQQLPDSYRHFTSHARRSNGLVSFNWDIVIESALKENQVLWEYDPQTPTLPLIKPHGSINWSRHEQQGANCGAGWRKISHDAGLCWWLADDQNMDPHQAYQDPFPDWPNANLNDMLFPWDTGVPEQEAGAANAESVIRDRRALWDQASRLIFKASKIVFLGYSLPEYDTCALNVLRGACKGKRVEVVNPTPDDAESLMRRLGPDMDFEIKLQKFEDSEYAQHAP
jgi:hypothetical protein